MVIVLTGLLALFLSAGLLKDYRRFRAMPRLSCSEAADSVQPFISVLIPARNEAYTIARCLDGVLALAYEHYEVIVVNDASTDETGAIVERYAAAFPRVRVMHSESLPPGWTGKAHACQLAADAARGEWLLFLDADTVAQPTLLAALVACVQQRHLDLLTVFPFLELGSFWERVVLPPFRAIIYATFPFERQNAPDVRTSEVIANGQCLFVRRAAYAAVGGHGAVRGAVLEDVSLARTLHAAGCRTGVVEGGEHALVRMYTGWRTLVEGLGKNAAAGYVSGGERALWVGLRQFLQVYAPLWLVVGGLLLLSGGSTVQGWFALLCGCTVAVLAAIIWGSIMRGLYHIAAWYTLLWPFGLTCYGIIALWSVWKVRSGHGVSWKGRHYAGT